MLDVLKGEGVSFDAIHIDRHFEKDGSPYRKPGIAMLTQYIEGEFDLENLGFPNGSTYQKRVCTGWYI